MERSGNASVELEKETALGERPARVTEHRALEPPPRRPLPQAASREQLPFLATNGHPERGEHAGVGGKEPVQLIGMKLAVEGAGERDPMSVEDLDRVRDAKPVHSGT